MSDADTQLVPVPLPSAPPPERIMRIGGYLIDVADWPDDVIEKIKKDYLMPPASARLFLARITLTAVCPSRHSVIQNVGLMAETAIIARAVADGMTKGKVELNCPECGRPARVTGKHIYFAAPMSQWDGAL